MNSNRALYLVSTGLTNLVGHGGNNFIGSLSLHSSVSKLLMVLQIGRIIRHLGNRNLMIDKLLEMDTEWSFSSSSRDTLELFRWYLIFFFVLWSKHQEKRLIQIVWDRREGQRRRQTWIFTLMENWNVTRTLQNMMVSIHITKHWVGVVEVIIHSNRHSVSRSHTIAGTKKPLQNKQPGLMIDT